MTTAHPLVEQSTMFSLSLLSKLTDTGLYEYGRQNSVCMFPGRKHGLTKLNLVLRSRRQQVLGCDLRTSCKGGDTQQRRIHLRAVPPSGGLLFERLKRLQESRFERAVLCVNDGILDPHQVATPELLPSSAHLVELQASGIALELHLCLNTITPELATAYVLAGVHTVTFHLESFWLPNGWGKVDFDKLINCMEVVVKSCGRVGLCVYPTAALDEVMVKLKKYGALQLISQITVIMDELVLASKVNRCRYIPITEHKITALKRQLTEFGGIAANIEVVAFGSLNTCNVAYAAAAGADAIVINDIDRYNLIERTKTFEVTQDRMCEEGFMEIGLHGRSDLDVVDAVYVDAFHRVHAAQDIYGYLERQFY